MQTIVFIKTKGRKNMDIKEINKKIQIEKNSYARDLNRLQNEIFKLKRQHQRTMEYWQRQKEQTEINKLVENLDLLLKTFRTYNI